MTTPVPRPARSRGRPEPSRIIGSVATSCAGIGGAISITVSHGSSRIALLVFCATQVWGLLELACRWWLKLRYARLHEFIARKAAENPGDPNLRTLLADVASTSLDDVGGRIPVRKDLE